jgi:hypothetical protein
LDDDVIRSAILSLSDLVELPSIAEAEPVASEDDRDQAKESAAAAAGGRP